MTYREIIAKYPDGDFSHFPGDKEFRNKVFAPLFENLYENKMIYHEHAVGWLIQVGDIEITPDSFRATASVISLLYDKRTKKGGNAPSLKKWEFGSNWDWLMLSPDNSFHVPYANFTIWLEEERIKRVEQLVTENRLDETYNVVWNEVRY